MKTNERTGDIWFTSDPHYGHANIIKYCDRPFADAQEMDEALIANYNALVKPEDSVYFLGDFCFSKDPNRVFQRLNGKKHLILGNHDLTKSGDLRKGLDECDWEWIKNVYMLRLSKKSRSKMIWMGHYAHLVWPNSHKGSMHLHGHSHGDLHDDGKSRRLDAGVDAWGYKPVHLDKILEIMLKRDVTKHRRD
jgi:calcineurin-like phosphoesterase family protein